MNDRSPCVNWAEKLALRQEDLPPAEHAALKAHLATCSACAAAYADYHLLMARVRALPEPRGRPVLRLSSELSSHQEDSKKRENPGDAVASRKQAERERNDAMQFLRPIFSERKTWPQRLSTIVAVLLVALVVGSLVLLLSHAHQGGTTHMGGIRGTIHEFPLPSSKFVPQSITTGPDGNLWFTEVATQEVNAGHQSGTIGKIGRITLTGRVTDPSLSLRMTLFPLPPSEFPTGHITMGSDGNLWFPIIAANHPGSKIGRITPTGKITEFPLPPGAAANGITTGPDGNLWFTESFKIGQMTPTGRVTEFPLPPHEQDPQAITTGPDGNLWFSVFVNQNPPPSKKIASPPPAGKIVRMTPQGRMTQFPLPNPENFPMSMTAGPDGNLWYAATGSNNQRDEIGRVTLEGQISTFSLPHSVLSGITAGSDGALWFTEVLFNSTGKIGRITTAGEISEFPLPTPGSSPAGITNGPDGKLWFTIAGPNGQNGIGHLI